MSDTDLLNTIPTLQAAALVGDNAKFLKKKKKNLVGQFTKNVVGIELIKVTRNSI